MSNIAAMRCSAQELYVRGANGVEWTITKQQVQAIYQATTGSAASRKSQTITTVLNQMQAALGVDQANAAWSTLDFNPLDVNSQMILGIRDGG